MVRGGGERKIAIWMRAYQEDHDGWYELVRHCTVEELEVVDETVFVGAAVDAADEITRCGFVVQLSKIRTLE